MRQCLLLRNGACHRMLRNQEEGEGEFRSMPCPALQNFTYLVHVQFTLLCGGQVTTVTTRAAVTPLQSTAGNRARLPSHCMLLCKVFYCFDRTTITTM